MALILSTSLDSVLGKMAKPVSVVEPKPFAFPTHTTHTTPKVETTPDLTPDEMLVSEFITLHRLYESINGRKVCERMDAIKKQLQLIANSQVGDDEIAVFSSPAGELEFSRRTEPTVVSDPVALLHTLIGQFGVEVAVSVLKFAIGDLKKVMSEAELQPYTKKEPGSRSLKSVRPTQ